MHIKLRIIKKDENSIPYNSFCKGITKCACKNVVCSKMCLRPSVLMVPTFSTPDYMCTCLEDRLFEVVLRNFKLEVSEYSPNFPGLAEYNSAILCKL